VLYAQGGSDYLEKHQQPAITPFRKRGSGTRKHLGLLDYTPATVVLSLETIKIQIKIHQIYNKKKFKPKITFSSLKKDVNKNFPYFYLKSSCPISL